MADLVRSEIRYGSDGDIEGAISLAADNQQYGAWRNQITDKFAYVHLENIQVVDWIATYWSYVFEPGQIVPEAE